MVFWAPADKAAEMLRLPLALSALAAASAIPAKCPIACENGICSQTNGTYTCAQCYPGWVGPACADRECPSACHGRGKCDNGACVCEAGRAGLDCSLFTCPADCSKRGNCDVVTGQCACSDLVR